MKDKTKNKSRGYKAKIAAVAVLGVTLALGTGLLCILLFTDLIFERNIQSDAEGIGTVAASVESTEKQEKEQRLIVNYNGSPLYAGGQAVAENFDVQVQNGDGSLETVTGYTCDQLSDEFRLSEGENTFEFQYMGMSASIDVNAVNIRTLPYPPDYVIHYVDSAAAAEKAEALRKGSITFEEAYQKVAFTGDSQIVGLVSNGILGEDRIVAKVGESYDWFEKNFDRVVMVASNCDSIIVHYGINTLSSNADERAQRISQYRELLVRLKEALPHLRIIVSGVFPVSYSIFGTQDRFMYINEYDYDLVEMCMDIGVEYLSDSEYMLQNSSVFGPDGLHLTGDFYRSYWLENIIEVMGL